MASTASRHLSVRIDRLAAEVYAFAADPAHLPRWAWGLGGRVVQEDGQWFVETDDGRAMITFAAPNPYGVLDHEVVTPSGTTVVVPLRVVADGDGCEVVLTLRGAPGATPAELDRDATLVTADLARLKAVLETGAPDRTEQPPLGVIDEVVIDCARPDVLAAFWARVLGGAPVRRDDAWWFVLPPGWTQLSFQRVPEGKSTKNRLHLDVRVDDLEAATVRAEAWGARRVGEVHRGTAGAFQVLLDPEGNEWCVVRPA